MQGGVNELLRSDDSAVTFSTKVTDAGTFFDGIPVVRSADGTTWLAYRASAGAAIKVYSSADNGDTLTEEYTITSGATTKLPFAAAHPTDANTIVFAGWTGTGASTRMRVVITTDGGTSFSEFAINSGVRYFDNANQAICAHFTSTGRLILLGNFNHASGESINVFYSDTPGNSASYTNVEVDTNANGFACDPLLSFALNSGTLFIGVNNCDVSSHTQLFFSTDDAATWTAISVSDLPSAFSTGGIAALWYDSTNDKLYVQVWDGTTEHTDPVYSLADPTNAASTNWVDETSNLLTVISSINVLQYTTMGLWAA